MEKHELATERTILPRAAGEGDRAKHGGGGEGAAISGGGLPGGGEPKYAVCGSGRPLHRLRRSPSPAARGRNARAVACELTAAAPPRTSAETAATHGHRPAADIRRRSLVRSVRDIRGARPHRADRGTAEAPCPSAIRRWRRRLR